MHSFREPAALHTHAHVHTWAHTHAFMCTHTPQCAACRALDAPTSNPGTSKSRGNTALALLSSCPPWLTKPGFLAFGGLRAFPLRQLRCVYWPATICGSALHVWLHACAHVSVNNVHAPFCETGSTFVHPCNVVLVGVCSRKGGKADTCLVEDAQKGAQVHMLVTQMIQSGAGSHRLYVTLCLWGSKGCMHTRICTHARMHTDTYTHTHIHTYAPKCTRAHMHTHNRRLCAVLRTRSLPLEHPCVHTLLRQCLYQLGPACFSGRCAGPWKAPRALIQCTYVMSVMSVTHCCSVTHCTHECHECDPLLQCDPLRS